MEPRWLSKEHKKLLAPHAGHFEDMALFIRESSDDDLLELRQACVACSMINCGWSDYAAAEYLLKEIATEFSMRERQRKEASA